MPKKDDNGSDQRGKLKMETKRFEARKNDILRQLQIIGITQKNEYLMGEFAKVGERIKTLVELAECEV